MGQIVQPIFITAMVAHPIGIILGDLSIYKVRHISVLAVFTVVLLEPVGVYLGFFIFGFLIGGDISVFLGWFAHTALSIAGYNRVTKWSRNRRSRAHVQQGTV